MKRTLSNQFLSDYLVVFLFTITATILAFFLLSAASGIISKSLVKNKYPASSIMMDDYELIDAAPITQSGGGVQIVDDTYQVIYSSGIDTIGKSQLSIREWTDFLIHSDSKNTPYHYDIMYNPQGEFWLIVTFPTSIRIDFSIVTNKDAIPGDVFLTIFVIGAVFVLYVLLLTFVTFFYSRVKASGITRPLQKLCEGTMLLREGDYSVRVDLNLKNEFAQLQDTFNDMAERIEHEMELRKKSENDRRQLILDISHDLKNPLASVSGYAELCSKKPDLPEKERSEYLQVIYNNSQRANLLLNELFELSQLDSPEFALKLVKTDLSEQLRRICGDLIPSLEQAEFQFEFNIPEKSIFVMLDLDKFSRIFQNLADNVIRYNAKDTKLNVRLSAEEGAAIIRFSDNGCGIPAHLTQDIFKPFVRTDDSRHRTAGSGLGLSIAKKIAVAHNGDLTLQSSEKQGCTFILTLPLI